MGLAIVFGLVFSLNFGNLYGGTACIKQTVLRWYLWRSGCIPWNYVRFLDYAVDRILLRKVGGYMFVHRLLLDHFAALEPVSSSPAVEEEETPLGGPKGV